MFVPGKQDAHAQVHLGQGSSVCTSSQSFSVAETVLTRNWALEAVPGPSLLCSSYLVDVILLDFQGCIVTL